jgi:cytoskeleton protein RodZ
VFEMTPQVGQRLREARTQRGIQLNEVERATKIRLRFLRAIEDDCWDELPSAADARGFISAYASFLGLDEQALVDEYANSAEKRARRRERIPGGVVRRGDARRERSIRPLAIVLAGIVGIVVLGVIVVASLGGSGNGGGGDHHGPRTKAGRTPTSATRPTGSQVSLELHSTADVWVCLVDERDRPLVNGETLAANQVRGPFDAAGFDVTFGNGSVQMTVNGQPAKIPDVSEPLGYRVTPSGVRKLDPSSQPTCL